MAEYIDPGRTWTIMRRYSTEDAEDGNMERLATGQIMQRYSPEDAEDVNMAGLATGRMEEVIGDLVNACAVTPGRLLYIIYNMVKWQSHRRA